MHDDIAGRQTAVESAARLAAIVESSDDAIIAKTLEGIITCWNRGAERIFGYPADEVIGRPINMLIPADRIDKEPKILDRIGRGERVEHFESVRLARDGRRIDVSLTISPIFDAAGRVIGASKIARDISERKHDEEAIARLAAIVESSNDSIMSEDLDGVIMTWNDGASRIFGHKAEEVIGRPINEILVCPYRPNEAAELLDRVKRGDPVRNHETQRLRRDGSLVDVSVTLSLIRDRSGGVSGVSRIHRDISDRKRAEDQVHRSERNLSDFFENATIGLHLVGPDGTILRANRAELEMLGYERDEYLGHNIAEFYEDGREIKDILRRLKRGETLHDEPARLVRKDGSIREVLIDSSVCWEDGQFVHTRCFTRDVTDWNRSEAARRDSDRTARSILDSLPANIAVVDETGEILARNRSWSEFARESTGEALAAIGPGSNYLRVCDQTRGDGEAEASAFAAGIRAVLSGASRYFSLEYRCPSLEGCRWFVGRVTPFLGEGPRRVVISHIDVTVRRMAEEATREYAGRLESLRAIDLAILSAQSTGEIAGAALDLLARLVPCWVGSVMQYQADRGIFRILAGAGVQRHLYPAGTCLSLEMADDSELEQLGRRLVLANGDTSSAPPKGRLLARLRDDGLRSYILIPLVHQGRLGGALFLGSDRPHAFDSDHVDIAREVADHLAVAMRQALLLEEVRLANLRMEALSRQLLQAQEDERRRIARELHDEVGQCLTAAKISVDRIARGLAQSPESSRLADASALIGGALEQVRDLSRLLRPSILDDLGLDAALRALCESTGERVGLSIDLTMDPVVARIDPEVQTACYRMAQEALNNAAKHARAKRLRVSLRQPGEMLELVVADDGVGFDPDAAMARAARGNSMGLLGLRERAALTGGRAEIQSIPGQGTQVRVLLPAAARIQKPESCEEGL